MQAVGRILLGMLDDLVASSSWWYHGSAGHAERLQGTLLLLDRTEDSVSPALHFCTYQALVNDLLNVRDGNVITIKAKDKEKEVLLNEKDELWVKFRHMHIADVLGGLSEYLDSIKARNPQAVKVASGADGTTIQDMSKFVKAMPEYQAQLDVYSQHLQIAQSCMSHIQAGGQALLNLITDVEQTLATGFDPNGKALRLPLVIDSLLDEMASDNAQLKLRLVLILAASQREKLSEADLDRVCTAAGFTAEERSTVSTLRSLDATSVEPTSGGESSSSTGKKKGKWTFSKKLFSSSSSSSSSAASAAAPAESDFASSRFVCPIKAIAEDLVNGKLSATDFPPLPSGAAIVETKAVAQSVRRSPGWGAKSKPAFSGARSIIFMAGGVAFAELQAVALASTESNKEILLGGTSILTQKGFIEALASV
jgi:syntaxin-binding protein 1